LAISIPPYDVSVPLVKMIGAWAAIKMAVLRWGRRGYGWKVMHLASF